MVSNGDVEGLPPSEVGHAAPRAISAQGTDSPGPEAELHNIRTERVLQLRLRHVGEPVPNARRRRSKRIEVDGSVLAGLPSLRERDRIAASRSFERDIETS
jgi:hypothetical protein